MEHVQYWPQWTLAFVMLLLTVFAIVQHGKPLHNPDIDAKQAIWCMAWFALILGAGGFWRF